MKAQIESARLVRLDLWLARQPLTPSFNGVLEQAEAFKIRLREWAQDPDPRRIAPTFHPAPQAC